MKISVYSASDMILDYLVAVCEGWTYLPIADTFKTGRVFHMMKNADGDNYVPLFSLQYSQNWSLAGPIIERENISIAQFKDENENSRRSAYTTPVYCNLQNTFGATSLIAAMRCYVIMKLGEEVEVPDTLFQES